MMPAKSFYDRILWDPSEDATLYTICYEDRAGLAKGQVADPMVAGVVEVTFSAFTPEEVPWHRIRQFRCAGRIVWERQVPTRAAS